MRIKIINPDGSASYVTVADGIAIQGVFDNLARDGLSPEIVTHEEIAALQPTTEEIIADYEAALDSFLDAAAQEHRFKDRHSLALRAAYPNAWQELGAAFGEWMDGVNIQAYGLLNEVLEGSAAMPTKEEFIASLPAFVRPI